MFSPTYLFYLTQKFKKHSSFLRIKKINHNKLIIQNQRHKYLRGSIQRSFAYRTTRKIILPSIIQVVNQFDKMFKQIDGSIYRISRIPLHESNGPLTDDPFVRVLEEGRPIPRSSRGWKWIRFLGESTFRLDAFSFPTTRFKSRCRLTRDHFEVDRPSDRRFSTYPTGR